MNDRSEINKGPADFYRNLPKSYLTEVRRFVPKYDEMVRLALDIASSRKPSTILDLGAGVGNVEEEFIKILPEASITAVESLPEMSEELKNKLSSHKQVDIITADIRNFEPNKKFDFILSNLVIHNIPYEQKELLLKAIGQWLNEGGIFVWSDLIKLKDPIAQEKEMAWRKKYALEHGADQKFADENFRKETQDDYMLTVQESIDILQKSGFNKAEQIFVHDTSATFQAEK